MSTPTSHVSTYSRYVGRVGALAAALGIGVMVVTSPGVAAADATDTSSESSSTSSANSTSSETSAGESSTESAAVSTATTGADSTSTSDTSGATSSSDQVAPRVTVSSSGGAHTSTTESEAATAPTPTTDELLEEDTSAVETPPDSGEPADATIEPTEPSTPPATPAPEAEPVTSTSPETESNSTHPATVNTTTPSTSTSTVGDSQVVAADAQSSSTVTEASAVLTAQALQPNTTSNASTTQTVAAAATTPATPTALVATPTVGIVGFLNSIVTNLLNPFLAPAPNTQDPFTPVVWAVLGWVRRQLFNQAPTITYNPTTTVQTGQTLTGKIGAADPEGDALTYTVTQAPQHGTVTIDQATGNFTYTPNDINYTAVQTDSFTISVADGKFNLLSLFSPHSDKETIGVNVLNPTVERVIVNLPAGYTNPDTPRFAADGESLYFAVTPPGGTRMEIHQINVDGTDLRCVTCGLSPNITGDLGRVVPAPDGRLMIQIGTAPNSYVVYEPVSNQLVPVITPPAAARVLDPQREMRISPDGKYVLFSQIQLGQTGNFTAVPVVGRLVRTTNAATGAAEYQIEDARVIFPVGEAKQWTPDGRGVIITGGQYEMGNVDNVLVDLATGAVTRLTANLDYDEDIDMSPNGQWIAVGSTRTYDALTPMTRIVRPPFLPAQIQGAVYEAYRGSGSSTNVSNQEWLVAIEDELKGENGIPLFIDDDPNTPEDEGDNYNARSMASWNADGTAVAFWEAQAAPLGSPSPGVSRLVIANLKYTTSVGPVEGDLVTPHPTWAPKLSESVPTTVALPPVGTHAGAGGGTATITEVPDPTNSGATLRTVVYNNYVNVDGLILNGSESTSATASQNTIRYTADITVTGTQTGYLRGDVTINKLTRTITPAIAGTNTPENPGSMIRSSLDGDLLVLLDPNRIAETRTNA
jgi:hypothetical protein